MGFLTTIVSNLFKPTKTEAFPFAPATTPESYRGKVVVDPVSCVGCSTCAKVCVSDAIRLQDQPEGVELIIWHSKCTFCGLCAFYCPTDAMTVTNEWELHHPNDQKYAMAEKIVAEHLVCVDCGETLMVPQEDVISSALIGTARSSQRQEPRCSNCRREQKARQIKRVAL